MPLGGHASLAARDAGANASDTGDIATIANPTPIAASGRTERRVTASSTEGSASRSSVGVGSAISVPGAAASA